MIKYYHFNIGERLSQLNFYLLHLSLLCSGCHLSYLFILLPFLLPRSVDVSGLSEGLWCCVGFHPFLFSFILPNFNVFKTHPSPKVSLILFWDRTHTSTILPWWPLSNVYFTPKPILPSWPWHHDSSLVTLMSCWFHSTNHSSLMSRWFHTSTILPWCHADSTLKFILFLW